MERETLKNRAGFSRIADRTILVGLVLLTVVTWLPRLRGPLDMRWDAGVYFTLGTSLAEGKGYRLLNEPGDILAVQYPPGIPLLIAAHEKVAGTSDYVVVGHWLRITYLLLSLGYSVAVFRLARDYLNPFWAGLAGALCMLAFQTLYMSDVLYAEMPFALTATLFVLFIRRAERRGYAVASGILAVTGYLLRTAGIALLATWVVESLIRRRFKEAALRAVLAAVPVLAWQGYIGSVTSNAAYRQPAYAYQRADYQYSNVPYSRNVRLRDPFAPEQGFITSGDVVRRVLLNTLYIPSSIGQAISTPEPFWQWPLQRINHAIKKRLFPDSLVYIPLLFLGFLSLAGLIILAYRREWPLVLFTLFSLALVCLTPWREQFTRYMTPLVPMLLVSLVIGVVEALRKSSTHAGMRRYAGAALLAVTVIPAVLADAFTDMKALRSGRTLVSYTNARGEQSSGALLYYISPWQSLDASWEWVRRNAASNDVMATTVPHTAFVHTGVKSILEPLEIDPAVELRMLDSVPVRYVVTDDLPYPKISVRYVCPAVCDRPDLWRLVFESRIQNPGDPNPSFSRVYERVRR